MDAAELSAKLEVILADFPEIGLVYLFGSRVSGQVGPLSDYDFAILTENPQDELDLQARFQYALVRILNTDRVDVVLLQRAPIELAYRIIADGKLLYQRDVYTRVEFEADTLSRYGDYLPVLRSQREQILRGDTNDRRIQRYREALGRTRRTLGQDKLPKRS